MSGKTARTENQLHSRNLNGGGKEAGLPSTEWPSHQ